MVRLISRYPDGITGAALLLMRFSSATVLLPAVGLLVLTPSRWWLAVIFAAIISLAIMVGFRTRAAAMLLALGLAVILISAPAEPALLLTSSLGGAGALALLGPGAYSLDAHLFGRRVILIDSSSPPDRGGAG